MPALLLRGPQVQSLFVQVFLGLVTAVALASANYTINEWLDRDFDKHHPTKSGRPAVQLDFSGFVVLLVWGAFVVVALSATLASDTMLAIAFMFALQGVAYNVPPLRTKDRPISTSSRSP